MSYERQNIRRMTGYASGEQPEQPGIIKLNTNENPYPATPAVAAALAGLKVEDLRRYPQPLANEFRTLAAQQHQLTADCILPTNGGDELLRLVITTFVDAGDVIAVAEPSYSLYPVLAAIQDCEVARIPLGEDWRMAPDFVSQLNATGAKLAFIVNPHAPTGLLTSVADLRTIADQFQGVLVIDEAYVDFIDPDLNYDATPLIREFDNVLILRTMSKGYSLAGLRFAYGMGAPSLIAPMLYKTRDSYNTDVLSQVLATAALQDREAAAANWTLVRQERARVAAALEKMGFSCPPSQSNFLLATVPAAEGDEEELQTRARRYYQQLKDNGILVRYFDQPRLRDKLRITIGTFDENQRLLACLEDCVRQD